MRTTGILLTLVLAACGGGKGANEPGGYGDGDGDGDGDSGDYVVSEEKMEEINNFFQRKQSGRAITDCWVKAMESDDLPDGSKGRVTLNMTIATDGRISKVEVASLQPAKAKTFESCVVGKAKSWTVTSLEQPYDTSWTFQAGEL